MSENQTNNEKVLGQTSDKYVQGIGRRKTSVANVRVFIDAIEKIEIKVNDIELSKYFSSKLLEDAVKSPLKLVGIERALVTVKINGGGKRSQAEAIRLGLARALIVYNEDNRKALRAAGYLTRDPRMKERKKPGLKRARRAPQFSKR